MGNEEPSGRAPHEGHCKDAGDPGSGGYILLVSLESRTGKKKRRPLLRYAATLFCERDTRSTEGRVVVRCLVVDRCPVSQSIAGSRAVSHPFCLIPSLRCTTNVLPGCCPGGHLSTPRPFLSDSCGPER